MATAAGGAPTVGARVSGADRVLMTLILTASLVAWVTWPMVMAGLLVLFVFGMVGWCAGAWLARWTSTLETRKAKAIRAANRERR